MKSVEIREAMKAKNFQAAIKLAQSELIGKRVQISYNGKVFRDMEITNVQISSYQYYDWRIDGITDGEKDCFWIEASYFPAFIACGYIIKPWGCTREILYFSIH